MKEALTEEYRAHLIGLVLAAGFLGYWYFPRSPVRPVAVHPVKGCVLMDGKPLANAIICLHQVGSGNDQAKIPKHLHPHGKTDEDGAFTLETFEEGDGAFDGEFVATVFLVEEKVDADGETSLGPNLLPAIYSKPETSPFKLEITSDTEELEPLKLTKR